MANVSNSNLSPDVRNHLDVKLHGIRHLPTNWTTEGGNPMYDDHPFRYTVSLTVGETTREFTNGRIVQAVPVYTSFVEKASFQNSLVDASEEIDGDTSGDGIDGGTKESAQHGAGSHAAAAAAAHKQTDVNGGDAERPAFAMDMPDIVGGGSAVGNAQHQSADASGRTSWLQNAAQDNAQNPAPEIMWVFSAAVDTYGPVGGSEDMSMSVVRKNEKKKAAANTGPLSPSLAEAIAVKPTEQSSPPCVVRIPLNSQQMQDLEMLAVRRAPLSLTLRRNLRQGVPPDWEDTAEEAFRATIPLSLDAFLEPGVLTSTQEVALLSSASSHEGESEAAKEARLNRSQSPPAASRPSRQDTSTNAKKKNHAKKKGGAMNPLLTQELDPLQPHPYTSSGTCAVVSLTFNEALTRLPERRKRPQLLPCNLIPQRKWPTPQKEASAQFSHVVASVSRSILQEYRRHAENSQASLQATKTSFLDFFQSSGALQACQEIFTPVIRSYVKEHFTRYPDPTRQSAAVLANEVYVSLMDAVHATLRKEIDASGQLPPQDGDGENGAAGVNADGASSRAALPTTYQQWKLRSEEAEAMQDPSAAVKAMLAGIASCGHPNEPESIPGEALEDAWCALAELYLRTRDTERAEQSFREALAVNPLHVPSLLGYGVYLLSVNRREESAVYLHAAVDESSVGAGSSSASASSSSIHPQLVWGCVALLCDLNALGAEPDAQHDETVLEWERESHLALREAMRAKKNSSSETSARDPATVMYLTVARYLVFLHLEDISRVALAKCAADNDESLLQGKAYLQMGQLSEAVPILEKCLREKPDNTDAAVLLGKCYADLGRVENAIESYQLAFYTKPPAVGYGSAYVRFGNLLIGQGKYEEAAAVFTDAVQAWPCGLTWLGLGIAYNRQQNDVLAEEALGEANTLNNLNPKTWGFLALTTLRQGPVRYADALMALNYAFKCGLSDPFLLTELSEDLLHAGLAEQGERCLDRALAESADDVSVLLHLASTFVAQARLSEAREIYSKIAETTADPVLRDVVAQQARVLQRAH